MMPEEFAAPTLNPTVILQSMDEGAILLDKATGACFELNVTAMEVWLRLGQDESPDSIAAALAALYSVPLATISSDIRDLLTQLSRLGLLTLKVADV